jgi:enoyl-CoA hydratase
MSELLVSREGAVAIVSLNRPRAMNALSRSLLQQIAGVFAGLSENPEVRAVILTGEGDRAFCAGLDLRELSQDAAALQAQAVDPVRAVSSCSKPVIGAINGVAITGGFELALACDVLIASTAARFADTHARVGVLPGWGLSQKLSRIIGVHRAKELSFTGNFLDAERALAWGIINQVVAPEALLAKALELAGEMAQVQPGFLASYKRLIDDGYDMAFGDAMALEQERAAAHNRTVQSAEIAARRVEVQQRGRAQRGSR